MVINGEDILIFNFLLVLGVSDALVGFAPAGTVARDISRPW